MQVLEDRDFNVEVQAVKMRRVVEMYQWEENTTERFTPFITLPVYSKFSDFINKMLSRSFWEDFNAKEGNCTISKFNTCASNVDPKKCK